MNVHFLRRVLLCHNCFFGGWTQPELAHTLAGMFQHTAA